MQLTVRWKTIAKISVFIATVCGIKISCDFFQQGKTFHRAPIQCFLSLFKKSLAQNQGWCRRKSYIIQLSHPVSPPPTWEFESQCNILWKCPHASQSHCSRNRGTDARSDTTHYVKAHNDTYKKIKNIHSKLYHKECAEKYRQAHACNLPGQMESV